MNEVCPERRENSLFLCQMDFGFLQLGAVGAGGSPQPTTTARGRSVVPPTTRFALPPCIVAPED